MIHLEFCWQLGAYYGPVWNYALGETKGIFLFRYLSGKFSLFAFDEIVYFCTQNVRFQRDNLFPCFVLFPDNNDLKFRV